MLSIFIIVSVSVMMCVVLSLHNKKESFVPIINRFYKPRVRDIQNYFSKKWNMLYNNIQYILKKNSLL